jgi:hypothetical protein
MVDEQNINMVRNEAASVWDIEELMNRQNLGSAT